MAIPNLELSVYTKCSTGKLKVRVGNVQFAIGNTNCRIGITISSTGNLPVILGTANE